MKKILIAALLLCACLNNSRANTPDSTNVVLEGKIFSTTKVSSKQSDIKTGFSWKDSKGNIYPIYLSSNNKAFVWRISAKSGKKYRYYLPDAIAQQIIKSGY